MKSSDDQLARLCLENDCLQAEVEELQSRQNRLLEEKERSEAILDAIGTGVSVQDRKFRIIYQNRAQKELFGEHPGELCYSAYGQGDRICRDCPIAWVFKEGRIQWIEKASI